MNLWDKWPNLANHVLIFVHKAYAARCPVSFSMNACCMGVHMPSWPNTRRVKCAFLASDQWGDRAFSPLKEDWLSCRPWASPVQVFQLCSVVNGCHFSGAWSVRGRKFPAQQKPSEMLWWSFCNRCFSRLSVRAYHGTLWVAGHGQAYIVRTSFRYLLEICDLWVSLDFFVGALSKAEDWSLLWQDLLGNQCGLGSTRILPSVLGV